MHTYVRTYEISFNHSHEIKSQWPIIQVLLIFSFFVWHLLSILLMGGALVIKHVVSYCQISAVFTIHFTEKAIKLVVHY